MHTPIKSFRSVFIFPLFNIFMDKKALEIALSKLHPLTTQKINLEQYQLEGSLAAELLWIAFLNGDIQHKTVADFGCGNGILGIGALLLGAKKVFFVDLDEEALTLAKKNSYSKGSYFLGDVSGFSKKVDTVVMNPPFGVQTRKADKPFLEQAMKTSKTIYSIHKTESKQFIATLAKEHHFLIENVLERKLFLKKTYSFHTHNNHPVNVGIWILRLSRT